MYLSDVGLLRSKFRLEPTSVLLGDRLFTEFKGVLSENYVLTSLVRQFGEEQFYWSSGNTAEIEFMLQYNGRIIPIEVKSGNSVTAKAFLNTGRNIIQKQRYVFQQGTYARMTD